MLFGFQDVSSLNAKALLFFHNDINYYLLIVMVFVIWVLALVLQYVIDEKVLHRSNAALIQRFVIWDKEYFTFHPRLSKRKVKLNVRRFRSTLYFELLKSYFTRLTFNRTFVAVDRFESKRTNLRRLFVQGIQQIYEKQKATTSDPYLLNFYERCLMYVEAIYFQFSYALFGYMYYIEYEKRVSMFFDYFWTNYTEKGLFMLPKDKRWHFWRHYWWDFWFAASKLIVYHPTSEETTSFRNSLLNLYTDLSRKIYINLNSSNLSERQGFSMKLAPHTHTTFFFKEHIARKTQNWHFIALLVRNNIVMRSITRYFVIKTFGIRWINSLLLQMTWYRSFLNNDARKHLALVLNYDRTMKVSVLRTMHKFVIRHTYFKNYFKNGFFIENFHKKFKFTDLEGFMRHTEFIHENPDIDVPSLRYEYCIDNVYAKKIFANKARADRYGNFLTFFTDRSLMINDWIFNQNYYFRIVSSNVRHSLKIEWIWTLIPAAILFCILYPSLTILYLFDTPANYSSSLTLKVIGHQWYWSYEIGNFSLYQHRNELDRVPSTEMVGLYHASAREFTSSFNNTFALQSKANWFLYSQLSTMYCDAVTGKFVYSDTSSPNSGFSLSFDNHYVLFLRSIFFSDKFVTNFSPRLDIFSANKILKWGGENVSYFKKMPNRSNFDTVALARFFKVAPYNPQTIAFDSYMIAESDLIFGQPRLLEVDRSLSIPVGVAIRVLVTATDVLHSWAVPALGVKIDAVPGRLNQFLFVCDRPGIFYGQCSELCGVAHGFMPIKVEAVSVVKFLKLLDLHRLD